MPNVLTEEQFVSTETAVLDFVRAQGSITNRKFRKLTGLNYDQAIWFFNRMLVEGKLQRLGTHSGTRYELPTAGSR